MTERKDAATPERRDRPMAVPEELLAELRKFARRLAGFGLGHAVLPLLRREPRPPEDA